MPTTLTIKPWPDPLIDTIGHDPRSLYVETFWLPTLGPTALLLCGTSRRASTARPAASSSRSRTRRPRSGSASATVRAHRSSARCTRLEQFDLACADPYTPTVAVRRNLPPVNRRHIRRLPADAQAAHAEWAEAALAEAPLAAARRRARRVALALLEQGDDLDHVERVLFATGFHPAGRDRRGPLGVGPTHRSRTRSRVDGSPHRLTRDACPRVAGRLLPPPLRPAAQLVATKALEHRGRVRWPA